MTSKKTERPASALAESEPRKDCLAGELDGTLPKEPQKKTQGRSKWREEYKVHPAADVFPMMSDEELRVLGEDIKANGLNVPLAFCWVEGGTPEAHRVLIDGRNRLEAMERVGIRLQPQGNTLPGRFRGKETATIIDSDPVAAIIGLNIHRRHLTKQEQIDLIVAARTADKKPGHDGPVSKGGRGKIDPLKAAVIADAKAAGIDASERTVKRSIAKAAGREPKPKAVQPTKIAGPKLRTKPVLEMRVGIDATRRLYVEQFAGLDPAERGAELQILMGEIKDALGKSLARARLAVKPEQAAT
jgi:hypothetical protein